MASPFPSVLFAGHSFVKRLHSDLQWKFYFRAALDFNLTPTATVSFHGVGGLTVPRLARELRLLFSHQPPPQGYYSWDWDKWSHFSLSRGCNWGPFRLGQIFAVRWLLPAVSVCKVLPVLPRRHRSTGLSHEEFNTRAATFNKMLDVLFDDRPSVFVWDHLEMQTLSRRVFLLYSIIRSTLRRHCVVLSAMLPCCLYVVCVRYNVLYHF